MYRNRKYRKTLLAHPIAVYLWSLCRWANGLQLGPSFVTDAGDLRLQQVLDVQNYTAAATSCQAIGGSLMGLRGMSDITGGLYKDALVGSNTGATMWIGLRIRIPPAAPKTAALPKKLPVTARQLQQNWGEGAAEATILMSSALMWDNGASPAFIRTQLGSLSLHRCPTKRLAATGLECCATVFNVGAEAYGGSCPLIQFTLCSDVAAAVCEMPTTAQLRAPPRPQGKRPPPPPRKPKPPPLPPKPRPPKPPSKAVARPPPRV
ncbi:hypothetical protein V8C86DRAFT_2749727 [Haematococcus lacustris]